MKKPLKIIISFLFLFLSDIAFSQISKVNMLLWLKADSGVTYDGFKNVQQWNDYSGNNNHFVQGTIGNMPLWKDSVFNDKPGLLFNGTSTYLESLLKMDLTQGFTFFIVGKNNLRKNFNGLFRVASSPVDSSVLELGFEIGGTDNGSGTFNYVANRNFGIDYRQISNAPPAVSNFYLYEIEVRSDSLKLFINGILKFNIQSSASLIPKFILNGFLGFDYSSQANLDGVINELLIYKQNITTVNKSNIYKYLSDKYYGKPDLGRDTTVTTFCPSLGPYGKYKSYVWSTGDTTKSIKLTNSGTYWIKALDDFGFSHSDTVQVVIPSINYSSSFNDTICVESPLVWNTQLSKLYFTFKWQDNSTDSLYTVSQTGKYSVKITDWAGCTVLSDTVSIYTDNFSQQVSLGPDTTFCSGNSIVLKSGAFPGNIYTWSDNSTGSSLTIISPGKYWVNVSDKNNCTAKDTIDISISGIAPKASFSYLSSGCKGDSIKFTDFSLPPGGNSITGRLWDFGDTKTSSLTNPVHLYQAPNDTGVFNVKLSVTTNVGCSKDTTLQLHIYPKPLVFFSNSLACSGDNVGFTNLSDLRGYSAQSYSWNFADPASGANNTSTLASPNHKFTASGVNAVKFVVLNNKGCADSLVKSVTVQPAPTAQFSTSLTCEKQKIFFTDNSTIISPSVIQTWKTDFGDAGSSTIKNPNHTYNIAWTYIVKYIVGANNGCYDTVITPLTIYNTPLAKIGLSGPFCVNDSINLIDSSIVNSSSLNGWLWTVDGAQNFTVQNPKNPFSNTGSHSAKLVVTSLEGCKDSTTRSFTINALPTVGFTFSPTYGDPPLAVSFTNLSAAGTSAWDFGDTFQSGLTSPTHTYQDSGTYTISLALTDNNGCVNSSSQTFQLQYAKYDIALLQVQADVDADNFLNVTVSFGNASTRPLTAADFIVDIDGDNGFKESWTGNLSIGGISSYTFKTSPRLNTTSAHNYICVTAKKPNGFQDANSTDNEICIGLKSNEFILPEPSPNPASDYITIPLIVPSDAEVELIVYDKLGQAVSDRLKYSAIKGFNTIKYYTYNLGDGVYSYEITYKSAKGVKKFVKFRN
ncbi:MAG: PKD domain-containing protein [Bacteroidetes bacterium]|nr:PKD domain-containing protein [Bacteroidota bacterium]